ncbi:helix-turn-helix domain-containing protein [Nannocystis sp. SCPEA4]|uniref:AraC family transcriptional regulator n=1 Tax=Nannocystis sp. SCPEA4 TaxID=2996787 RepID=UPI00226F48F8|nr:helix-turn-helix domain-containing protein [Nannocystis sp. SCPEA4]MCY1059179.1 helix-turn-helix domain-containing protein [Nannocystis sp. SCPEA4]
MHPGAVHRQSHDPSGASTAAVVEVLLVHELDAETPHVLIPRAEIEIVVRFGPAARRGIDAHVLGAREHVRRKVPRGIQRSVGARLRLGASEAVLGVPAATIAGRIVALEDLWGEAAARRLFERLAATRDGLAAAKVLDAAIAERVATDACQSCSRLALQAAERLRHNSFVRATVNAVADELGVSERHLRRVFREAFGIGPKAFAKLARFQRALRAAREDGRAAWATIAADAGYYDQAHLIAEFHAIAGAPPRALLGELRVAGSIG